MGPGSTRLIKDLNNMTDAELADFVAVWQSRTNAAVSAADYELQQAKIKAAAAMNDMNEAILDSGDEADAAGYAVGSAAMTGTERAFARARAVANAKMGEMNEAIADSGDEAEAAGGVVGSALLDGVYAGMWKKAGIAIHAAREIARDIAKAMAGTLEEKSPSKVGIRIGGYASEGLAIGLRQKGMMALKEAGRVARGVVGQFASLSTSIQAPSFAMAGAGSGGFELERSNALSVDTSGIYDAMSRAMQDNSRGGTLIVPVTLNGREIARATVNDMDRELQAKNQTRNRAGGAL
jgi:hypothetical protein